MLGPCLGHGLLLREVDDELLRRRRGVISVIRITTYEDSGHDGLCPTHSPVVTIAAKSPAATNAPPPKASPTDSHFLVLGDHQAMNIESERVATSVVSSHNQQGEFNAANKDQTAEVQFDVHKDELNQVHAVNEDLSVEIETKGEGAVEMEGVTVSVSYVELASNLQKLDRVSSIVKDQASNQLSAQRRVKERPFKDLTNKLEAQPINLKPSWTGPRLPLSGQ